MPEEFEEEEEERYGDEISEDEIDNLVKRAKTAESRSLNLTKTLSAISEEKKDSNFLHLQISTEEMLKKLEHFYKCDIQVTKDGNTNWEEQPDKDLVTFNEFGVSSLMELITKYIDRNTILSSYPEQRIYEILGDLGDDFVLFMLCNYEKIGMDTYFKKTKFRMIISSTLHIIESTYRRALKGKTIEELNQSRVIGQFGELPTQINRPPIIKKRGWLERAFH